MSMHTLNAENLKKKTNKFKNKKIFFKNGMSLKLMAFFLWHHFLTSKYDYLKIKMIK